jgi:hypothetical protein
MKNSYAFAAILFILVLVVGCGGGSQTVTPPPPVLAITLSTAPPATLAASGTVSIAATVTNDSANGGVDWSCSPAGACGTFNPAHTASGAATTYTAPSAAGNVTIVAAATSKSSTTASAAVTVTAATAITVTLSTAPPTSLAVNATASVAATVANDTANAGVDWSCSPVGTCGSFNPTHTASAASTTYTAPAAAVSVTITAASTTTPTITASAPVNITSGTTATLSGNFTFSASGMEANSRLFSLAGVATLTAGGAVTGGEQDFNDGTSGNKSPAGGDQITGGSYTLGADGRGTLTLITNNTHLGAAGTETFSIVMVNSSHLLIESFDSTATSSGSMDLQSPVLTDIGALSGAYSFAVLGKFSTTTEGFGGVITITGSGMLHDTIDINEGGTVTNGASNGTYTAQDSMGRGTLSFGGNTFVYYAVLADSARTKAFRIVVTNSNETDIGSAYAQAPGPIGLASIKGNYVLFENGNHGNTGGFVIGGQLAADGAGNVTSGSADESEGGTPDDTAVGAISGTYTMASSGVGSLNITWTLDHHKRGVYPVDPSINLLDPNNATGSGGAVVLSTDAHVGDGVLVQQTSTTAPSGNFGLNFHAYTNAGETDGVGQVAIAANGTLTGLADVNDLFHTAQASGASFSGALTPDGANPGRYTIPLTLTINGTPTVQTIVVYQISSSQLVFVQTDTGQFATGVLELQQ